MRCGRCVGSDKVWTAPTILVGEKCLRQSVRYYQGSTMYKGWPKNKTPSNLELNVLPRTNARSRFTHQANKVGTRLEMAENPKSKTTADRDLGKKVGNIMAGICFHSSKKPSFCSYDIRQPNTRNNNRPLSPNRSQQKKHQSTPGIRIAGKGGAHMSATETAGVMPAPVHTRITCFFAIRRGGT